MTDMIVDANSLFARSWFAAQKENPDPLMALRYALNTVLLLLNPDTNRIGFNFDRTLFCWDGRQQAGKGRVEKPPAYHETKAILKDILYMMLGTTHAEDKSYEGDDLVATAVYNSEADSIYVVSGDKDLIQLKSKRVHYYCLNTKAVLSDAFIKTRWHIKRPSHIAIALAIIGDPVDKIPGVPGWGPKKVKKLFEEITPEMDFASVVEAIDARIPDPLKDSFYNALDKILLKDDVEGVPPPAPLNFADPQAVSELEIPFLDPVYRQVYHTYTLEP
jgi:5'-3' exonuclease